MRCATIVHYFVFAGAILFLSSCKKEASPEPIRPVKVEIAKSPEESRKRTFSGTAKASEEAVLSFKVSGTITSIRVNVGDVVEEGELLATLDPLDYRLTVEQTQAQLEAALARSRNAASNYDRVRSLYETRTASRTDLDNARAQAEASNAEVAAAEKALAMASRKLDYTQLRAPVLGAIAEKLSEVNENVQPNQPVLAMVSGTQPEVDVQIPENLLGSIKVGMPVTARFHGLGGLQLKGEVLHKGVATTGRSTTYPVTLLLDDSNQLVRSGMTAEITFTLPRMHRGVLVPARSVLSDLQGPFVYIVVDYDGQHGVVERRDVEVGELVGSEVEVMGGLSGGERVVTAGLDGLVPGETVSLYKGKPFGESE